MSASITFRHWARDRVKPLEVLGRHLLQWIVAALLAVRQQAISPPKTVLVVRLDKRVGNLLLLTPFLRSLKAGLPGVRITVLCHEDMARLLAPNPLIDALETFTKWALFNRRGIPAMLWRLRKQRFDVAFDAGSFFGAAVTHPLITRLSGAQRFVGPKREPLWRVYHAPVPVLSEESSDIQQRLQLLAPLPEVPRLSEMCFASAEYMATLAEKHAQFLRAAAPHGLEQTIACVIGARIVERRVAPQVWAEIVRRLQRTAAVTLVWGPGEKALADAVLALVPTAHMAPASTLDQAAILFNRTKGVVGHDTGTSHLAVAVGAATFVMFVCEAPTRYGHLGDKRAWIDLRAGVDTARILRSLESWLQSLS